MISHKPRHRIIPKTEFLPPFDLDQIRKELAHSDWRDRKRRDEINYLDAAVYVDRKARQAVITPRLCSTLRAVAQSFITNHEMLAALPKDWEALGANDAYEAARIVTVSQHVRVDMPNAYLRTLYDGIDLGDHAVRIHVPNNK